MASILHVVLKEAQGLLLWERSSSFLPAFPLGQAGVRSVDKGRFKLGRSCVSDRSILELFCGCPWTKGLLVCELPGGRLRKEVGISGLALLKAVGLRRSPELGVDPFLTCGQERKLQSGNFIGRDGDQECFPRNGLAERQVLC